MRIKREIYDEILVTCPVPPPETGGLIGGQNGAATHYAMDRGTGNAFDRYVPDVNLLNSTIAEWERQCIDFLGLFHTHFPGGNQLSDGDELYIKEILMAMPERIHRLYFPLVFPGDRMLCFVAERKSNRVYISKDTIELI